MRLALSLLIAGCLLAGCAEEETAEPERQAGIDRVGRRDLIGLDVSLTGLKPDIGYGLYDAQRDSRGSGRAFAGYGCMTDCKDIQLGYRTAVASRIREAKACTGATWGEVEGCVAYTQQVAPEVTRLPPLEPKS